MKDVPTNLICCRANFFLLPLQLTILYQMQQQRQLVVQALDDLRDHITLQDPQHQGPFKVSYLLQEPGPEILTLVRQRLRRDGIKAEPQLRCHWFLDVLPQGASRSEAIRFLALRWGLQLEQVLVMASQQGDAELMGGLPATVIPADHDPCLLRQRQQQRVFLSNRSSVAAVLDGLNHFRFVGQR